MALPNLALLPIAYFLLLQWPDWLLTIRWVAFQIAWFGPKHTLTPTTIIWVFLAQYFDRYCFGPLYWAKWSPGQNFSISGFVHSGQPLQFNDTHGSSHYPYSFKYPSCLDLNWYRYPLAGLARYSSGLLGHCSTGSPRETSWLFAISTAAFKPRKTNIAEGCVLTVLVVFLGDHSWDRPTNQSLAIIIMSGSDHQSGTC